MLPCELWWALPVNAVQVTCKKDWEMASERWIFLVSRSRAHDRRWLSVYEWMLRLEDFAALAM